MAGFKVGDEVKLTDEWLALLTEAGLALYQGATGRIEATDEGGGVSSYLVAFGAAGNRWFAGRHLRPAIDPPAVPGVGPDSPVVVNDAGGKQSLVPYRCDLLPARAILAVAAVLAQGAAKYGPNNWRKISRADNINHALTHLFAMQAGDTSDDHLAHALTRLTFAFETE